MNELIERAKKEAGQRWNNFDEAAKAACIIMQDCFRRGVGLYSQKAYDDIIDGWADIIRNMQELK